MTKFVTEVFTFSLRINFALEVYKSINVFFDTDKSINVTHVNLKGKNDKKKKLKGSSLKTLRGLEITCVHMIGIKKVEITKFGKIERLELKQNIKR